jgi:membrane fusion protein (multidrug efflux system)
MPIHDRTKRIVAGGLLSGILILGGCGQQPQTGAPKGAPPEVAVVTVQARPLVMTTELAGRTSANRVAEVRPQVGGIVQKRFFTEGSDVKAGQVLYRIDPAPYQAALDNAKSRPRPVRGEPPGDPVEGQPPQGIAGRKAVTSRTTTTRPRR